MMSVDNLGSMITLHRTKVNATLKEVSEAPKATPIFLGALEVGQEIIQEHTDFLMLNWRERVLKYETSHPEKKFIVKHVKRTIVVRRIK